MSESFFFACIPRYLKVEHSFAKTIKPNTKFRIIVFKGIQKCDEMKQGIRSKLVGGKIDLEAPELFFNIPFYNPTKNIHFTLKLYEEKPNEEQTQIASFTIMSSDYIRSYKNDNKNFYQVDGMLKDDLSIGLDLIVQKSKFSLTDAMKKYAVQTARSNKQFVEDAKSQSSSSKQIVRQGEEFISPRKKLQRKAGHKGKLRSRNSSRSDGERSPEGSVASSRRKWKKSPPSGDRFIHSPNKVSPQKASEKGKSVPKSEVPLKSVGNKNQTLSHTEVNQKAYKYQPGSDLKYDVKNQINSSPLKSQLASKQNVVDKPQVARSHVVSPQSQKSIQSPVSQSAVRQVPSQSNVVQSVSPRTITQTPSQSNIAQPTSPRSTVQAPSQISRQPITSPRSSKSGKAEFQIKHTPQVFDVVQKTQEFKTSETYQYQPQRASKILNNSRQVKGKVDQKNKEAKSELVDITFKKTQSIGDGTVQKQKLERNEQVAKVNTITQDDKSEKIEKQIKVKAKPVKRQQNIIHQSGTLKGSLRLTEIKQIQKHDEEAAAQKIAAERKNNILYAIFLVVSVFLIYNAMMPTRRV